MCIARRIAVRRPTPGNRDSSLTTSSSNLDISPLIDHFDGRNLNPTLVTVGILKVIECWNSYLWPRLVTDDPAYYLVSNGIQEIRENGFGRENIPAMMAAVVVISVPLIVLFLVFRKKIMAGVSQGGVKG